MPKLKNTPLLNLVAYCRADDRWTQRVPNMTSPQASISILPVSACPVGQERVTGWA